MKLYHHKVFPDPCQNSKDIVIQQFQSTGVPIVGPCLFHLRLHFYALKQLYLFLKGYKGFEFINTLCGFSYIQLHDYFKISITITSTIQIILPSVSI